MAKKYFEWVVKTYSEIVQIEDAQKLAAKYGDAGSKLAASYTVMLGSIWRQSAFYDLRFYVIPDKGNYFTTAFKLQHKESDVIYAIMYSTKVGLKIEHKYCCLHHTFASMDGEFRRNFIKVEQIDQIFSIQPKLVDVVESHYLEQLAGGKFIPHCETVGDSAGIAAVNESIDKGRWPIKLLVAHWITTTSLLHTGDVPSHISPHYVRVFMQGTGDLYRRAVEFKELPAMRRYLTRYYTHANHRFDGAGIRLGQKFTMPSLTESREPMDISHGIWREIFIAGRVSALVINCIAVGVPMMADWFMIAGSSPMLFDNEVSQQKLINSERGLRLSRHAAAARGYTFKSNDSTQLRNYYSAYMERLDEELEAVQDLAEEHTILSSETICQVVEDVGFTWGNLIQNMEAAQLQQCFGPIFSDIWMFSRYLFDILYTLMAMNDHCGVLQGDLHYNNATFYLGNAIIITDHKRPRIMYRIGDKLYLFPHYGRYACVIDYSRALLDAKQLDTADIPADVRRRATLDQHARAYGLMHKFRPEYATQHRAALLTAIDNDFTGAWQVLRVVDSLQFCANLAEAAGKLAHDSRTARRLGNLLDVGVLRRQIQPLLKACQDFGNTYLDSGLRELVAGEKVRRENPAATLILRHFGQYELGRAVDLTTAADDPDPQGAPALVDYLAQTNTIRYSTTDPDKFPPLSRIADLERAGFLKLDPEAKRGAAAYRVAQAAAPNIVRAYALAAQAKRNELHEVPRPDDTDLPDVAPLPEEEPGTGSSMPI